MTRRNYREDKCLSRKSSKGRVVFPFRASGKPSCCLRNVPRTRMNKIRIAGCEPREIDFKPRGFRGGLSCHGEKGRYLSTGSGPALVFQQQYIVHPAIQDDLRRFTALLQISLFVLAL